MKHDDVREIAERFIASQDMRGHTARFVETKDSLDQPDEWSVIFDIFSPRGNLIDGPVIVRVNKGSLKARFVSSP